MASAEAVARYLLHLAGQAEGACPITHMQLQKLMYYVQGWALATHGKPLFAGRIEAWEHGPVVRALYPKFADYKNKPIPEGQASAAVRLTDAERALIESVWTRYGQYSAPRLRAMTDAEAPWREARAGLPEGQRSDALVSEESMRRYFVGLQQEHCRRIGIEPRALAQSIRHAREGRVTELELPRGRGRVAG
ncbi:MAG TPA: type II toxin-antitoxin system antitoxin SocA domain-containing protein [Phycisphaerales bacterium]|nr:type II toxin-antitoxin system antitoxin SocA domain-containing protein [Phycisphaerales bacterium]